MTSEELKNELGGLIWKTATSLVHGGKVSPVQFMDYMLGVLFYRFVSENITDYCNHLQAEAGVANPDYASMKDDEAEVARGLIVNAKGFFILPSQLFVNVANLARSNDELNTTLANNFRAIEQSAIGTASEDDVRGLFDNFNTNDGGLGGTVKERNETLTTLLESVRDLNFLKYTDSGLDVFGICYEHLIKMYALNSGTKGGEFYTPAEVSLLLARIAAAERSTVNKVYDPACGSGSLLLNFNRVLGSQHIREGNKNKLSDQNIERIYQTHRDKRKEAHFSRVVTIGDVEAQDFNLSVSTYVEPEDTREVIDIRELNARIAHIVEREDALRREIDLIVAELEAEA